MARTQKELVEITGLSQSTVSERLKSIMAKSPLITCELSHGQNLYSINPAIDYKAEYWQKIDLIKLETNTQEAYRLPQLSLSGCYRYVIGIPIGIIINNSSRIPDSLSVNSELCMSCDLEKCLGFSTINEDFNKFNFSCELSQEPINQHNLQA